LTLSRFAAADYLPRVAEYLRQKYAAKHVDAVVAVLGPSLDFVLGEGRKVFPDVPVVFCGIDRREIGNRVVPVNVTGVLLKREFAPTLNLALELHPDTTQVFLVGGTSDFDAKLVRQAREEFRSFERRVAFTDLTTSPLREILERVSHLPAHSIVLYSTMFRDAAGNTFSPHEVASQLSAAANVPVYGFIDQYIGRGLVGGRVYSLDTHGQQAAALVRQILNGSPASALPFVEPANSQLMFDARQLARWHIAENRLPAGSDVRFRETSVWERYRWAIAATVVVLVLQAALITALLFEVSVRRRAQTALRQKEALLGARTEQVRDLAGRLITAQEAERARIARELHDDIGQRLAALSISISGIRRDADGQTQTNAPLRRELLSLHTKTIDLCESIRHISHELHPAALEHVGIGCRPAHALRGVRRSIPR
jgi:ABC-type uncharacterized transport system substrate-binding protein